MTDAEIFEDYARKTFADENACACVSPFEVRDIISEQQEIINRQKAEIERLNNLKRFEKFICERIHTDKELNLAWEFATKEAEQQVFEQELEKLFDITTARTEAIKEFAERLKGLKHECGCNYRKKPVFAVTEDKIDNLVKEMVGDG